MFCFSSHGFLHISLLLISLDHPSFGRQSFELGTTQNLHSTLLASLILLEGHHWHSMYSTPTRRNHSPPLKLRVAVCGLPTTGVRPTHGPWLLIQPPHPYFPCLDHIVRLMVAPPFTLLTAGIPPPPIHLVEPLRIKSHHRYAPFYV